MRVSRLRIGGGSTGPIAGVNTFNATGLTAGTTYYDHFYQESGVDTSNVLSSGSWKTLGPSLSLATATNLADTTATIGVTTDTAGGQLYYYVSNSATPPSIVDLKAGTGAVKSGSIPA